MVKHGLLALRGHHQQVIAMNRYKESLHAMPSHTHNGGLILLLLVELLIGKPLSVKTQEWVQKIGLSLIAILMVVVLYNDIVRVFNQLP